MIKSVSEMTIEEVQADDLLYQRWRSKREMPDLPDGQVDVDAERTYTTDVLRAYRKGKIEELF